MKARFSTKQVVGCLLLFISFASPAWSNESVSHRVDLLESIKGRQFVWRFDPESDPAEDASLVWAPQADLLKVSSHGYGEIRTKGAYQQYHLVFEFKWGDKTWGSRESRARDAALLIHADPDAGESAVRVSLQEGATGDFTLIQPKAVRSSQRWLVSEATPFASHDYRWHAGASRERIAAGTLRWARHDSAWVDRKGFRGPFDLESPPGEWNRVELIAQGGRLKCLVNGAVVNEAVQCSTSGGSVGLRNRGVEMVIRRFDLYPVGEFSEKWNPIQASGGTDISVLEGQSVALSAEESLTQIQLDGPYEAQLVASEPLVLDPVECVWDARGRMFVADMRDYPLGPKNSGDPWLSRIQMLSDEDGDGRMDKAVTFADHLDHVQGLLPYQDGLIATTRTQILFLRDNDGDGVADEIRPLIGGFNPRFSQLQVSSPRWGPDGWVYFNNGLDGKEIYPAEQPTLTVGIPRSNFRWNPDTGKIEAVSGFGQYGAAFDDFGHYFSCSNRNPVMFSVMPLDAVLRNRNAGIDKGWEDIAPFGPESRVYPLKITHTTADAHAGTNTACSGLGVYRGDLMPELQNNVFVPEPTAQLVTRYVVEPSGASLRATRMGARTEFFRSADEWCRPVNVTTGPDGAMYICDIYRRWIDHARFFPEAFVKTHDMREGENQGRIWRVVPKGTRSLRRVSAPQKTEELRDWLKHPNAWQRETAQRLLAENGERFKRQQGPETGAREVFLRLLKNSDVLGKSVPAALNERTQALRQMPEDPWISKAVLSAAALSSGALLKELLRDDVFAGAYSVQRTLTLQGLARASAASGLDEDFRSALQPLLKGKGNLSWWKAALLQGFGEGLPKARTTSIQKSIAEFVAAPPSDLIAEASEVGQLLALMDRAAADVHAPEDLRLACLSTLGQRKWVAVEPVLRQLLGLGQSSVLQSAALGVLKKYGTDQTAPLIYELLPYAGPLVRQELVSFLTASPKTALELFKRMETGEISRALVDIETRWRFQRGSGELHDLAVRLFGQASADRAAVVDSYLEAVRISGDAARGRELFSALCIPCHRKGGIGADVGPSLADVKVKAPEALLSDILDPNRMFEARYCAYQCSLKDGRSFVGLVSSESEESVTLILAGGSKEVLTRSTILEMKSLERSLMPTGLEAVLSKAQMADLLMFLRQP